MEKVDKKTEERRNKGREGEKRGKTKKGGKRSVIEEIQDEKKEKHQSEYAASRNGDACMDKS